LKIDMEKRKLKSWKFFGGIVLLILALALILTLVAVTLSSVIKNKAAIYDNEAEWIREEFYEQNRVYGAMYDRETLRDESYPKTRTFIVRTQEEFDKMFIDENHIEVDFEKEMLLVYTYKATYTRKMKIKRIKEDNGIMEVELDVEKVKLGVGASCSPFQRYVVLKVDKKDITSVEFTIND